MLIAGVDEAGRGALAGPVVVAAVILHRQHDQSSASDGLAGLADSKQLTARRREQLALVIMAQSLAWQISVIGSEQIDAINILQATLLGMRRAVAGLANRPDLVLVDGNQLPKIDVACQAIVGGDASEPAISAASILAKTHRDRLMCELDRRHPGYDFARHKGYPTQAHKQALTELGPCAIHRRSYAPVRAVL